MKKLITLAGVAFVFDLFAATVYRDATNVTSLVEFLNEDRGGNVFVIRLAEGDYDLTGVEMTAGNHLYLENKAIVGQGSDPWKTRLIGDGTKRILNALNGSYDGNRNCRIENLTCTNGCTTGTGGAVSGYPNVLNCVIIGNKAAQGGGLGSYTYCLDSLILNNTSTGAGGGVYNMNYLRRCTVAGNTSGSGGGGVTADNYGTLEDCVISNNTAAAAGGGVQAVRIITGCRIVNNRSVKQGGGVVSWLTALNESYKYWNRIVDSTISGNTTDTSNNEGGGGGVYGYHVTNCVISANHGKNGGGVCAARDLFGCRILDNECASYGGGVYKSRNVRECFISGNRAHGNGGGLYADIGETYAVVDSVICSNITDNTTSGGYGGGAYSYHLTNAVVFANYGMHGGGTGRCQHDNCDVHDNYGSGYGGGVYEGKPVVKTRIWNNVSSGAHGNSYGSNLIGCDVSGTGVSGGTALNSVFHDIGQLFVLANPYIQKATSNAVVYAGVPIATNCLFVNNRTSTYRLSGSTLFPGAYGQHLFQGADGSSRHGALVNCTIVSNVLGQTFSYLKTTTSPVFNVENCVFYGNRYYWGNADIVCYDNNSVRPDCIKFRNCAYGSATHQFSDMGPYTAEGSELYKFGTDGVRADPGFMGVEDPEHPYALKRSSPLRNRGIYEDWMASATDIRGEGYARANANNTVDIGCYQCWIPFMGTALILR